MKTYLLIILITILISCSGQTENTSENLKVSDSIKINSDNRTGSNKNDLPTTDIVFSGPVKIIIPILPSNKYLDSIQKPISEDEWNEIVSDNEYYRNLTEQFIIKKGYKLIERPQNRFWYFKLKDGSIQTIDTLNLHKTWGNIIFNGKDSAIIFEGTIPDIELKNKI